MSKKYYYQHDDTGSVCRIDDPFPPSHRWYPITSVAYYEHEKLPDGVPCDHVGCLSHVSHPCEGCGRVAGRRLTQLAPDLGWVCGQCKTVNDEERSLCGFCDTPRLSG